MENPVTIFANNLHNKQLQEEGYAIVSFLNSSEVETLRKVFFEHHPQLPEGMYASSHALDFALRKKMNDVIAQHCARAIEATFVNATALGATFMVKSKGANGSLKPHQDWSIVDETKFNSYNIWLPLVDVNETNGTLLVLPKNHTFIKAIRGLNIPSCYDNVIDEVWKLLIPLNVKAGDAVVYDHRLLHASGLNQTDQTRLTIVYGVVSKNAEMRYHFGNNGKIEVYECTPDFYFNNEINNGPAGLKQLAVLENNNPVLENKDLDVFRPKAKSWWQKILG
ncbi:MAG: phytanoyl-CoA dioxygenase family protein [Chitinophagales bacterium]|nr:phytanoyl-CoA dioxygenase family protein [Chitinophagales bacterium]